ncbi:LysR substrate-binding domain-containing protein [Volucribacter amazonae]|uniref:HTH lysR-type domain-containing protein n=1 Tax=Volucribacter amazonae TaxID=256731 RepID=A0A9X4PRC8_9PAST|nr:LysR substrate-binding domain-containing protein [Volucribacter amazonae]MDG6896243.1 hypothetical protein [Volucribacter amazonae]
MKTPFLNALQAVEASYRLQSFSAAAEELNVTPAAVGQLVKSLEDWLDKPLFIRKTGGKARLQATDITEQALPHLRLGLEQLALGLQKMKDHQANKRLNLTLSPTFASKWLLPHLADFQQQHPDIELFLNATTRSLDYFSENIDIGIRYGNGQWAGLIAEKWQEEQVFPVCSPAFLARQAIHHPSDLYHLPLIHDLSLDSKQGYLGWADWFAVHSPTNTAIQGIRINDSAAVLQMASNGQGIALARELLVTDDLHNGRLVRLFPERKLKSPLAYYIVHRPESCQLDKICRFKQWLMRYAKEKEGSD